MDNRIFRRFRHAACLALAGLVAISGSSCTTTYDYYGRPVQSVDPGVAMAGIAAAGLVGYALANDRHHHHGGYYGGGCRPRGGSHTTYGVSVGGGYGGGYYGGGY